MGICREEKGNGLVGMLMLVGAMVDGCNEGPNAFVSADTCGDDGNSGCVPGDMGVNVV